MTDFDRLPSSLLNHPRVANSFGHYSLIMKYPSDVDYRDVDYFSKKVRSAIRTVIRLSRGQFRRLHCFDKWDSIWENLWEIASGWKASYAE